MEKTISFDHPQITATTTWKFGKQRFPTKVKAVRYFSLAGLATHADNWFTGVLKNGSTVISSIFDTDTTGAAITAATTADGALEAAPDTTLAAGDELSLVATMGGTATLPYGRVEVDLEVL